MTIIIEFSMWIRAALGLAGLALVVSCICRARHMTKEGTRPAIRYATTALAGAGFGLLLSASIRPDWVLGSLLSLALATLAVQWVSARYWRSGLPAQFRSLP